MITQSYNLNLIPGAVPLAVQVSQYDVGSRTIEFTLYDGATLFDIPNGALATVLGTKSDNTGFSYSCDAGTNTISFDIKEQMTVLPGKVPCEIRITLGSQILGTANFELYVESTPLDDDTVISETDLPLLQEAIDAAAEVQSVLASAMKLVSNDTEDDIATFDGDGQVKDSGVSINDVATASDLADYQELVSNATNGDVATLNASGQVIDSGTALTNLATQSDLADYQELVSGATSGDIATLNANGQVADSGVQLSNLATDSELTTGLATKQNVILSGTTEPTSSLGNDGDVYILYSV